VVSKMSVTSTAYIVPLSLTTYTGHSNRVGIKDGFGIAEREATQRRCYVVAYAWK